MVTVVLLGALLTACAGPPGPGPQGGAPLDPGPDVTYVGGSADGALSVAVTVHDGRATGFTADGATGVWFDGAVTGGLLDLRAADGSELRGGVHGRIVHGGVVPAGGGADRSFVAVRADDPAGLYRADPVSGTGVLTWIRFPDGTTRGAAEVDGTPVPAPDPAPDLVVDGVHFGPPVRVVTRP
ncbi:hypothetical protein GCM10017691_15100 [Pseudonocardia petroleophila]